MCTHMYIYGEAMNLKSRKGTEGVEWKRGRVVEVNKVLMYEILKKSNK